MIQYVFDTTGLILVSLGLFLIAKKPASVSGIDLFISAEPFGVFSIVVGISALYLGYRRSGRESFVNYLVHRLSDWLGT